MRLVYLSVVIQSLLGLGKCDFYIVHAPSTMQFVASDERVIPRSEITGFINFLMGLPSRYLHKTESWPGLKSFDVFNPPKVNVLITMYIPNESNFTLEKFKVKYHVSSTATSNSPVEELNFALSEEGIDGQSFSLSDTFSGSDGEVDMKKLEKRLAEENSVLYALPVGINELSKDKESKKFLGEVQMLSDASDKSLNAHGRQSFHILLTALHDLAEKYGSTSSQVQTGVSLYRHFIQKFIRKLESQTNNKVLVEVDAISDVVPPPSYLVRHKRSANDSTTASAGKTTVAPTAENINVSAANLATPSTEDYPVIFSIVLWLMIAFFLAVLAASYSMWFMDPGKDNIIYRATTQRMKSD